MSLSTNAARNILLAAVKVEKSLIFLLNKSLNNFGFFPIANASLAALIGLIFNPPKAFPNFARSFLANGDFFTSTTK